MWQWAAILCIMAIVIPVHTGCSVHCLDMTICGQIFAKEAALTESEICFAKDLLKKIDDNRQVLDERIGELAKNYQLQRVYPTDKCALYIGLAEILFSPDVPYIVAIDEALSLCKKYSTMESVSFVNGIFAEFVKRYKND